MKAVTTIPRYRKFIAGRDIALEKILHDTRLKQAAILRQMADEIMNAVIFYATNRPGLNLVQAERTVRAALNAASGPIWETVRSLRLAGYILAAVSEAEALSQALGKPYKYNVTRDHLRRVEDLEMQSGGALGARVGLYMDRLGRRILDQLQLGLTLGETPTELGERVNNAMPYVKTYQKPAKVFRRFREAGDNPVADFSLGFIDDSAWQWLVEMYKAEVLPTEATTEMIYDWELDRDSTDDFINATTQGQLDTFKENKLSDQIWIAIIDDRTDECCLWRDGLTVTEIAEQLNSGDHKGDVCRAIVPLAHPNCRCRIAAATPDIDSNPLPLTTVGKDFDEWLAT